MRLLKEKDSMKGTNKGKHESHGDINKNSFSMVLDIDAKLQEVEVRGRWENERY